MPDQITSVINAIGKVKIGDTQYIPKIARHHYDRTNRLIPATEQVTFSNLRQVVEVLSTEATSSHHRSGFYRNNPIPGVIWRGEPDNPILVNADEIMPNDYSLEDLHHDIDALHAKTSFIARKAPKYYQNIISYEPEATKSILVCSEQGTLRCTDRGPTEGLQEYYINADVQGDADNYFDIHPVSADEQLIGSLVLLGELPVHSAYRYPTYIPRDIRNCSATSNVKYKAVREIRYT